MAGNPGEPNFEALELLREQVEAGGLDELPPYEFWDELAPCLMKRAPERSLRILRDCGALGRILPEVEALFGVPQIAEGELDADLGELILNGLHEAALCDAPLSVRYALLVMNVGKSDSPAQHLPVHYRHIERGRPRIEDISARFSVSNECLDLALLAIAECERVHRVSRVRAGPVAAMLGRLDAFDDRPRFERLMTVCACDFRAYKGRAGQDYPKAALLAIAIDACSEIPETLPRSEKEIARTEAIARAFGSERWSGAAS
jgi:tRNA nucleotidyltransferase (CCA-adding enzyme)